MLWFSKNKPVATEPAAVAVSPALAKPSMPTVDHHDIVLVTLKKVLRTYGVPPHWVHCDVQPVDAQAAAGPIRLVLTMNNWNAQLLQYSLTLQQHLLHALALNLTQFEPVTFQIYWAFSPACVPPTLEVPHAGSWLKRPVATEAVGDFLDRRKTPRAPHAPHAPSDTSKRPAGAEATRAQLTDQQDGAGFDKTAIAPFPFS